MRSLVFLLMFLPLISLIEVPASAAEKNSLQLEERWIGDFDGMVSRHMVRVLER